MNAIARYGLIVNLALSCSAGAPDDVDIDQTDSVEVTIAPVGMPDPPATSEGHIALSTSHREDHYAIEMQWDGWAGRCESSGMLQIVASTDGYGIAVLIAPSADRADGAMYPIAISNDSMPPDGSARVALQIYPEDRAYVLKGVDGDVEVDTMMDILTGRFTTRLVESTYRDTVYAAGSFTALPIETVGEDYCRAANAPPIIPGEGLEPKPIPGGQEVEDHD